MRTCIDFWSVVMVENEGYRIIPRTDGWETGEIVKP